MSKISKSSGRALRILHTSRPTTNDRIGLCLDNLAPIAIGCKFYNRAVEMFCV
jgi:hypothetical protein